MQELEKILKEIDQEVKEYMEIDFGDEYNAGIKDMAKMAEKIIRKHMNDGWISVEERDHLPEAGEHVLVSIGTGFNPEKAFLSEDGHWTMLHAPEGYNDITDMVDAWRPLPEPYRPERSDNHDGE